MRVNQSLLVDLIATTQERKKSVDPRKRRPREAAQIEIREIKTRTRFGNHIRSIHSGEFPGFSRFER